MVNTTATARRKLTEDQFNVCFLKGTEMPGSGKWLDNAVDGMYVCVVCGNELFAANTKFDSNTGWPSFWDPVNHANIRTADDFTLGMRRTEVTCAKCGAHLGHVFADGPKILPGGRKTSGMRYCINSLAMDFTPRMK